MNKRISCRSFREIIELFKGNCLGVFSGRSIYSLGHFLAGYDTAILLSGGKRLPIKGDGLDEAQFSDLFKGAHEMDGYDFDPFTIATLISGDSFSAADLYVEAAEQWFGTKRCSDIVEYESAPEECSLRRILPSVMKRPELYLQKRCVIALREFIDGFRFFVEESFPEFARSPDLESLEEFVCKQYGLHRVFPWHLVIWKYERTSEIAFARFFDLLENFSRNEHARDSDTV